MNRHSLEETFHKPIHKNNSDKHENEHESSLYLQKKPVCPCCSYFLLRHISVDGVYWYCSHCHQKMPPGHNYLSIIT